MDEKETFHPSPAANLWMLVMAILIATVDLGNTTAVYWVLIGLTVASGLALLVRNLLK